MAKLLRVFISSPGDVGLERDLVLRVIERLRGEFGDRLEIETIRWEDRPVRATQSFQPQIVPPSETDLVVCILWSRLGTPLSEEFKRRDGTRYGSGTEWEFEDAVRGWRETGTPDLLVYRRTQDPLASIKDASQFQLRQLQFCALEDFVQKWFFGDDGTFKAAFKSYAAPDQFERMVENDLRHLLLERLPWHSGEPEALGSTVRWHKGSPYCGLSSFDIDRAAVFFGRTRSISEVKEALVRQAEGGEAFVVIFGMSGCGKSSLARAGVLATITRPGVIEGVDVWRSCVFRPTDSQEDLCCVLAGALVSTTALPEFLEGGGSIQDLATALVDRPQHAIPLISMAMRRAVEKQVTQPQFKHLAGRENLTAKLVVVVDQLEEIFTRDNVSLEQRLAFVDALAVLARSGHVWVLATMRSDYYPRCLEVPELVALKDGDGQYDLLPPTFDEIDQMITYPTRAAGLRFEVEPHTGERLDAVLHQSAANDPQALPLLSFTLDELYRRRTDDGFLTFAAYRELGGLEGALAQRAEEVFLGTPVDVQATLPALIRGLVTVEPAAENIVGARRVPRARLEATPQQRSMLDALINARLLVTDRSEDGEVVVRVAHEALLTKWPRVRQWLVDDREFLRIRTRLVQQADRWRREGNRSDLLLPTGRLLAEADEILLQHREDLDWLVAEFVTASLSRRQHKRIVLTVLTMFLGGLLTTGGTLAYSKWEQWSRAITLTAADREKNRRQGLRLEFEKTMAAARAEMLNPIPSQTTSALDHYEICRDIATALANTTDQAQRIEWNMWRSEVLLFMSDAYGVIADRGETGLDGISPLEAKDKIIELLDQRKSLMAELPSEVQNRLRAETEFSYARRLVVGLQTEYMIADEEIKLNLWKQQVRQQVTARESSFPDEAIEALTPQLTAQEQSKIDLDKDAFVDKSLRMIELVADASGQSDDWELYAHLAQTCGKVALEERQRLDRAEALFRLAIVPLEEIIHRISASSANSGARATPGLAPVRDPLRPTEAKTVELLISVNESLANVLLKGDHAAEAKSVCERSLELCALIPPNYASNLWSATLYNTRLRLSKALHLLGDKQAAIDNMKVAVAAATASDARVATTAAHEVIDYHQLASVTLAQLGDVATARSELDAAVDLQRKISLISSSHVEERRLADLLVKIADFIEAHDQPPKSNSALLEEACEIYRRAVSRTDLTTSETSSSRDALIHTELRLYRLSKQMDRGEVTAALTADLQSRISAYLQSHQESSQPATVYHAAKQAADWFHELELPDQELAAFSLAVTLFEENVPVSAKGSRELIDDYYNLGRLAAKQGDLERSDSELRKYSRLARSVLGAHEFIRMQVRIQALSVAARGNLRRFDEIGTLVKAALEQPLAMDDNALLEEVGDELVGYYEIMSANAREADANVQAIAAAVRRRDLAQRMIQLGDSAIRREKLIESLNALGGLLLKYDELEQSAEAYTVMQEAAAHARMTFNQPSFGDHEADAADSLGRVRIKQGRLDEAEASLTFALELWQQLCDSSQLPSSRFSSAALAARSLAAISESRKDWAQAATRTRRRIDLLERGNAEHRESADQLQLAQAHVSLAWQHLLNHAPQPAIEASLHALQLAPDNTEAAINLVTAYLLNDEYEAAVKVYEAYRTQTASDGRTVASVWRADFEELRAAGVDHANFERLQALFQSSTEDKSTLIPN